MKAVEIFAMVWSLLLATGLVGSGLRYLQAHTKNQRLKVLETYALQAVSKAEAQGQTGSEKFQLASDTLIRLANQSGLKLSFSAEQEKALIEKAVLSIKAQTGGTK